MPRGPFFELLSLRKVFDYYSVLFAEIVDALDARCFTQNCAEAKPIYDLLGGPLPTSQSDRPDRMSSQLHDDSLSNQPFINAVAFSPSLNAVSYILSVACRSNYNNDEKMKLWPRFIMK